MSGNTQQPEALRLADALDANRPVSAPVAQNSAAELRRLHAENEALKAPQQAAPSTLTEQQAYEMGAKGAPATDAERLLFEAWMRGHCWALSCSWDGKPYRSDAEHEGYVDPRAMQTRRIWAAWRDRAALAAGYAPEAINSGAPQQAAPVVPAVGNSGFDHKTAADFLSGKTVSDEVVRRFVAASRWAHDDRASLQSTLLAVRGELASREAEIAMLKQALMGAEVAPQQVAPVVDEQTRRDAERIDWLEKTGGFQVERLRHLGDDETIFEITTRNDTSFEGDTLREAIDAAIEAQKGGA